MAMTQRGAWTGGLTTAALALCVLTAVLVGQSGFNTEVHMSNPHFDPIPRMSHDFTWWPVPVAIGAALAARLFVTLGGSALPSWYTAVVTPAITTMTGVTLLGIAYLLPSAYGGRCAAGHCVQPDSWGPPVLAAPFLLTGTLLAVIEIARNASAKERALPPPGVMQAFTLAFEGLGALLLLGSVRVAYAGSTDSYFISGPAVPVGLCGLAILCTALPAPRRHGTRPTPRIPNEPTETTA